MAAGSAKRACVCVVAMRSSPCASLRRLAASDGDGVKTFALAREQAEAEFVFELLELLADAGLRSVDAFGGKGDVEAGIGDGGKVTQLGQGHGDRFAGGGRNRVAQTRAECRQQRPGFSEPMFSEPMRFIACSRNRAAGGSHADVQHSGTLFGR